MTHWSLVYNEYHPDQEKLREALCTLGNGYFATRGALAHAHASAKHYPGTYIAGLYNRAKTEIADHVIENEDLVNVPNWLVLEFSIAHGEWFNLDNVEILDYRQELDIKRGVLLRTLRFKDKAGRCTSLEEKRLVHMRYQHLAALSWTLTAENWSDEVAIRSILDGSVINDGVPRYRDLTQNHLEPLGLEVFGEELVSLMVRTTQSRVEIAQAARTQIFSRDHQLSTERATILDPEGKIGQQWSLDLEEGQKVTVEKVVAMYTSRDTAISEPGLSAREAVQEAPRFDDLLADQVEAWSHLWERFDIGMEDHGESVGDAVMILRIHIFHLLQTVSPNSRDLDVGVPARGWHGEAYRGHIFWDELFIFPFLNLRMPEITRALLRYRHRRLPAARAAARQAGFRGAMFPWQSGSDGREESQTLHLNPKSGRWNPDHTHLQRHVSADIALNVWQYYQVTDDLEFLSYFGAEIILEVARFWSSIARYNQEFERYEIRNVVGPDEYHDAYPDSDEPGLSNNAYTNMMAVWTLARALDILKVLPEQRTKALCEKLDLDSEEIELWDEMSRSIRICFFDDHIISQFEGYEDLEEFDWEGYRDEYGDIQRLDRILEAENDTPNRYKASKQADVLMLFYLFSDEELTELFERNGYPYNQEIKQRNVDYYLARTSHGSTLSRIVHSWVLAESDRETSWKLFLSALKSDVADIQGGTTEEGIHLGAMAGTVDLVQRGFTGLATRKDTLFFDPCLPKEVRCLHLDLRYRGHDIAVTVRGDELEVRSEDRRAKPISIGFRGEAIELKPGETKVFALT